MTKTNVFRVPLKTMCRFYAVEVPSGFRGSETVRVFRQDGTWHVGPGGVACDGTECLTDECWAPQTDEQALDLYDFYQSEKHGR